MRTISDADLIIVLQDGYVAEQGTHEQLLAVTGGVYHRLWQAQLTESTQPTDEELERQREELEIVDEKKKQQS